MRLIEEHPSGCTCGCGCPCCTTTVEEKSEPVQIQELEQAKQDIERRLAEIRST